MEWSSPSIVLNTRPFGETDGIVSVLSLEQGLYRGLVKGMISRRQASTWQVGNFITANWSAKLSDQLGYLKGELVRANYAFIAAFPLAFAVMTSLCAVAEGGLLERQPVEDIARHSFQLLEFLTTDPQEAEKKAISELLRWELNFLMDLGYGLDFSVCHEYANHQSYFVSPRTGKVVTETMAGEWKPRLFRLPALFIDHEAVGNIQDWLDGLKLTQYFLEKNIFSLMNKPLPNARISLQDKIASQIE